MRITKRQLMDKLEIKTQTELASYFRITLAAVSQWPDDDEIPELRELQARQRNPELFQQAA